MSMKPVLKTKVDELFLAWFTQPETQSLLRTSLRQLVRGEPVTWPSAQVATSKLGNGVANLQPKSPRVRPTPALAGPPYSPTSSVSPRVKNFTGKGPRPLPIKVLVFICSIWSVPWDLKWLLYFMSGKHWSWRVYSLTARQCLLSKLTVPVFKVSYCRWCHDCEVIYILLL